MRVLEKQVEDGKQLRQQLLDQVHDIQKQLKNERDENKKLKKRLVPLKLMVTAGFNDMYDSVQLLEVDQKRSARVSDGPTNATAGPSVSDLQAEVCRRLVTITPQSVTFVLQCDYFRSQV